MRISRRLGGEEVGANPGDERGGGDDYDPLAHDRSSGCCEQRRSWRRAHATTPGRLSCSVWARRIRRSASIEVPRPPSPTLRRWVDLIEKCSTTRTPPQGH